MARELSQAAQAAKEIRAELKKYGIQAKVRKTSGHSVCIDLINANPKVQKQVSLFVEQYESHSFCGYTDSTSFKNEGNGLPKADYIIVQNQITDDLYQEFFELLKKETNYLDDQPELLKDCECSIVKHTLGDYVAAFVRAELFDMDSEITRAFWRSKKPARTHKAA